MSRRKYKILAIESSCDETSASLCEVKLKVESEKLKIIEDIKILSNIVSSQVKLHAKYGGVYPELASREHVKNIIPVIEKALLESNSKFKAQITNQTKNSNASNIKNLKLKIKNSFDAIAVTTGSGLIGSLLVGVETAKTLAYVLGKPIYPINHVEGHIYANFVGVNSNDQFSIFNQAPNSNVLKFNHLKLNKNLKLKIKNYPPQFPLIALVVSGGHTSLIYMGDHLQYKIIGETLDDAAGEVFDKVAKMLNLGYPGGPIISKLANEVKSEKFKVKSFKFPRPMINSGNCDFSFSGLKTSVLYTIKKLPKPLSLDMQRLICKEFQDAVVETLVAKTIKATQKYKVKSVLLCGGVAANSRLREELAYRLSLIAYRPRFFVPEKSLCTDNAAMIGVAAAYKIALGKNDCTDWKKINANANLKLK